MNTKLEFKIDVNQSLEELQKEFEEYKTLKLKYIRQQDKFSKEQKETFLENFYNAKLNTIFSILYVAVKEEKLSKKTNPFNTVDNEIELLKYSSKVCRILADLDVPKIGASQTLADEYHNLRVMVDESKKTNRSYLKEDKFWIEFIKFYKDYNDID